MRLLLASLTITCVAPGTTLERFPSLPLSYNIAVDLLEAVVLAGPAGTPVTQIDGPLTGEMRQAGRAQPWEVAAFEILVTPDVSQGVQLLLPILFSSIVTALLWMQPVEQNSATPAVVVRPSILRTTLLSILPSTLLSLSLPDLSLPNAPLFLPPHHPSTSTHLLC
jgi:hypothetical protein